MMKGGRYKEKQWDKKTKDNREEKEAVLIVTCNDYAVYCMLSFLFLLQLCKHPVQWRQ
jgi:hypothetical protein